MYDVIIIGAGPAGMTAAIYLKRANKHILVLEAKNYGGQIINANNIENYPACPKISGYDFATKLYNQIKQMNVLTKVEKVLNIKPGKIKKVITSNNEYLTKSIIIATGCNNKKLNILNEDKLIGHGISYCATCDGNFYKGKDVAIVGGGNTAIDDALYLSNIARTVYVIHRREEFRAFDESVQLLKKKNNVKFIMNSVITKLNGNDYLENIEINNNETIKVDGLFIAIGQNPQTEEFKDIINLNNNGYIKGNNVFTNRKGIFSCGDVREKELRQLVTATSDGAIAAKECIKYLNKAN